jgi:peptidoglycan/LPS O-acetylase OafA/YrhL
MPMFAGGLVLGLTLILFAVWLQQREQIGWEEHRDESELDDQYFTRRGNGRRRVHVLLFGCGALIVLAAFFGPGFVWGVCWLMVSVLLMVVVVLAFVDAARTHRYHSAKLPEIRRRLLGDDKLPDAPE